MIEDLFLLNRTNAYGNIFFRKCYDFCPLISIFPIRHFQVTITEQIIQNRINRADSGRSMQNDYTYQYIL